MKTNKKGISLVVLVITIIVLAILSTVVIVSISNNNVINKTQDSVNDYNEKVRIQAAEVAYSNYLYEEHMGSTTLTATEYVQEYLKDNDIKYDDVKITDDGEIILGFVANSIANVVQIGDYVNYIPDSPITSVTLEKENTGFWKDTDGDYIYDEGEVSTQVIERVTTSKWLVLDNDGTYVTLMSERPINPVGFGGVTGWKNATTIINDTCSKLYGGTMGEASNMDVEFVNSVLEYDDKSSTKWMYYSDNAAWENMPSGIKTIGDLEDTLGTFDYRAVPDSSINFRNYPAKFYTYTASSFSSSLGNERYELIFKDHRTSTNFIDYWLTSSCIYASYDDYDEDYGSFIGYSQHYIKEDKLAYYHMFKSDEIIRLPQCNLRPVIKLKANVYVTDESLSTDNGTSTKAWDIAI